MEQQASIEKEATEPCLALRTIGENNSKLEDGKADEDIEPPSKRQRKQRSGSSSSNLNLPLWQRIRQREFYNVQSITWGFILLSLSIICILHVTDRVCYYLSEPTSFQVTVDRFDEIWNPAITVCPAREPFHHHLFDDAFGTPDFWDDKNVTVQELWEAFTVTADDILITASCNESNKCDFLNGVQTRLNSSVLHTFWGRCVTFSQDKPTPYRGMASFQSLHLWPGRYAINWFDRPAAAQFYFHDPDTSHRHESFLLADLWSEEQTTLVRVTPKMFSFLNLSRDPCDSQEEVISCKNKCVDDALDQVVNCSLPFMSSKWPPCEHPVEAKQNFELARIFYYTYNWSQCICHRQCHESVYSTDINTIYTKDDNRTLLVVQITDNLIEIVYEEYSYSLGALISDIGGSVGVFLGLSILSFFEFCDEHFLVRLKKKNK